MHIGIVGHNSVEYIDLLVDIWNNGDCAVLLDCNLPYDALIKTMNEIDIKICYIDADIFEKYKITISCDFRIIKYTSSYKKFQFLPNKIYEKFNENYSNNAAIVIYSSGTTGKSKGVILSHYSINTNADMIYDKMNITNADNIMVVKKFSHSSTIVGEILVALKNKIKILLGPIVMPSRIIVNILRTFKITVLCVNPVLLKLLVNEIKKRNCSFFLEKIFVSGDKLYEKDISYARKNVFDTKIYNMYGLTECGPRVSMQTDEYKHLNSVGKPLENVKLQIRNDNGETITKAYEKGIVFVKTPCALLGYASEKINNNDKNCEWINTKDIGYIDENGELYIVGRFDDLIIVDSHKIYPNDVEEIITKFTSINECIVTTYCDIANSKNILCCLYVGEVDIRILTSILGKYLLNYEIPKKYIRVIEIPKNANGKIERKFIERYLENKEGMI